MTLSPAHEVLVPPAPAGRATPARWAWTLFKLAIAAGLIALLFYTGVISWRDLVAIASDPYATLPSLALLGTAFVLGGVRWFILLRAVGTGLRFRATFEIYAIGTFANAFLPGGAGGDVVRAAYLLRAIENHRSAGVFSIMLDRLAGVTGLLAVSSIFVAWNWAEIANDPATLSVSLAAVLLFFGLTTPVLGVLLLAPRLGRSKLLRGWREGGGWPHRLVRIVDRLAHLRTRWAELLAACLLSVAISSMIVGSLVVFAMRYDAQIGPLAVANAGSLAVLVTAVPLTPGGIGVGEAAFAYLCELWDASHRTASYGTIFLSYRLASVLVSLLSGFAFVTYGGPGQKASVGDPVRSSRGSRRLFSPPPGPPR